MKTEDWKELLEEMIERLVDSEGACLSEAGVRYNHYQLEQLQKVYEKDFGRRYEYESKTTR